MRIARILVVVGLIGLVVPVTAQAMPLSDPPGDVKRTDVDLLGGEIVLGGGVVTLRLKLAGGLRDRDVYTLRIFGQDGERWTLRATRKDGKSSFSARDERRRPPSAAGPSSASARRARTAGSSSDTTS